jgi:hypothetical protein
MRASVLSVLLRLAIVLVLLGAVTGLVPTPGPTLVSPAAAAGWTTHTATWWFTTEFWTVKQSVVWQTTDPAPTCRKRNLPAEPSGETRQNDVLPSWVSRCTYSSEWNHWYPIRNVTVSCWVQNAIFYGVRIDHCGTMRDPFFPNSDASQTTTVGSRYSVCLGPYQTLFGWCTGGWNSRLIIVGSMVRVWNNNG